MQKGRTANDATSYSAHAELLVVVHDQGEVRSLQGRAADQAAVDLGLGHQALDVLGIHGTAVLDAHLVSALLAIGTGDGLADHADGLVGLLIGGGQAGADGPHGLVRDDDLFHLLGGQAVQRHDGLEVHQAVGSAGFTDFLHFAHAQDGLQAGVHGSQHALVEYQTLIALNGLTEEEIKNVVIAYEPVWAIGTGLTATDEQANETIGVIRAAICRKYGKEVADTVRIQYGGSMNPKNVKGLMAQPEIDGGLIGGASLKAPDFSLVVNYDK